MVLLRKVVLILLNHNIKCTAVHIAGERNKIADALSRLEVTKLKAHATGRMVPKTYEHPSIDSAHQLELVLETALAKAYKESTLLNYYRVIEKFKLFLSNFQIQYALPVPDYYLFLFLFYLSLMCIAITCITQPYGPRFRL